MERDQILRDLFLDLTVAAVYDRRINSWARRPSATHLGKGWRRARLLKAGPTLLGAAES
jgi:hypothetical protein